MVAFLARVLVLTGYGAALLSVVSYPESHNRSEEGIVMTKHVPARSYYRGVKMTIVQPPAPDSPCVVSLSVKRVDQRWDEWSLLMPSIRVPVAEINGYEDILQACVAAVQAVLRAEQAAQ